ncbi:MAG: FtsX-like permease family protein, partial [Deltaproteobacteria bacterium]|nr:FtsX-like permease family protein [Deltaproteobacteria bacterium]
MIRRIPLAWLQISQERMRLLAALMGVSFAVLLVFMQLGFSDALFKSAVRYHENLEYDLVLLSHKTPFIGLAESFSRRRLYQARGAEGVASVSPLFLRALPWRNPWQPENIRNIFVVGVDPSHVVFRIPELNEAIHKVRVPDVVLFDSASRPEFGPVAEVFRREGNVTVEVANRKVEVAGLFEMGTSFGIDGSIVTSDLNFRRLLPGRPPGHIDLGLIRLLPGADPETVRDVLDATLEDDVLVFTRDGFIRREVRYWATATPIGYVFRFGVLMGLIVGSIIVYQILFADVSEHISEYATLKAMGYSDGYLASVVLQEAVILAFLGFVPGTLASIALYRVAGAATMLPLEMTWERGILVFLMIVIMCGVSALLAVRKLR